MLAMAGISLLTWGITLGGSWMEEGLACPVLLSWPASSTSPPVNIVSSVGEDVLGRWRCGRVVVQVARSDN